MKTGPLTFGNARPKSYVIYAPDLGFESPVPSQTQNLLEDPAKVFGRYRWTRNGLRGVDFGGQEVWER